MLLDPARVRLGGPTPASGPEYPDGALDVAVTATARREQAELRRRLTNGQTHATCGICNCSFAVDMLVAAHIKRRSLCTDAERRDLHNVAMLACRFGCDALFEDGYLAVDGDGTIVTTTLPGPRDQTVAQRLAVLRGRPCPAFTPATAPYFAWHHHNVFVG